MRKNLVPLLGIAFVVAILSTGIFYGLFVTKLRSAPVHGSGAQVAIAARNLDRGAVIQAADVKLAAWAGDAPKGAFTAVEKVQGLTVVSAIQQHEAVLESRVASPGGGGAGLGIPAGMRAISTHVSDSSGVIALLKPGHHVDVQLVSLPGNNGELRTILQNVVVLKVDAAADARSLPVVTLLVGPEEADALGLGDSMARIRLTLRNPLDEENRSLQRHTLSPLFQKPPQSDRPAPANPVRAANP
ncbi:MAG: Flp pilus assembly protein CpaB [Candidatus Solibacter usitatus]|nr:Flp pilus assembly protein CpaB [Candidatus Solibacter usitatus]